MEVGAIGVDYVNLGCAGAVRDEGELAAIRGPGWRDVNRWAVGEAAEVTTVGINKVDFRIAGKGKGNGNGLAVRREGRRGV